jgi:phospholipase C
VIDYDDSDGWYDHQIGPIVDPSNDTSDQLNGAGRCGTVTAESPERKDRCGVGPRLPLLVISPWARRNYVDGTFTEQSSITKFIEENWNLGKIGSGSLDVTSGSLDNMFDFDKSEPRSPGILLNDETGEIESEVASGESTVGAEGKEGKEGKEGPAGATGPAGPTGAIGPAGPAGAIGPAGPAGPQGKTGPAGPQGPAGPTPIVTCRVIGKGPKLTVICTEKGVSARVHALVSLARDHKVVAHGGGRLGSRIKLEHRGALHGRYTLFVEIPGETSVSSMVHL